MHDPVKHHFMDRDETLKRLVRLYQTHGSIVVAVDFDNTLFDFHYEKEQRIRNEYDFTEIYTLLTDLKNAGCYIVIWTANEDTMFIRRFLKERNIPYDALNENPPFFKSTSRKIYYNVLLDDASGLLETYRMLCQFLRSIQTHHTS
jgi:HAD superfamily phosphatase (TIGR01681 family)